MTLSYPPLNLEMLLQENKIMVLQIEAKEKMRELVRDLWKQTQGDIGEWVWYDEKTMSLAKNAELIINPFAIDCNNKKVLNKIYQDVNSVAQTEMVEDTMIVNSAIISYLEKVMEYLPYHMEYQMDMDIQGMMKLYDVRISSEDESLADYIVYYCKVMHQICGISLFCFINLTDFISENELKEMYCTLLYEKVQIVLIEGKEKKLSEYENGIIIDNDLCVIVNNKD